MPSNHLTTIPPDVSTQLLGVSPIDPKQLAELVESCNDRNGNRLRKEMITWRKTYRQFEEEGANKELLVMPAPFPDANGVARRLLKVSPHKVETFLYALPYMIVEEARTFLLTGERIPTTKLKGLSGTGRRGKPTDEEAAREIREETRGQIIVDPADLHVIPDTVQAYVQHPSRWRDSSVYAHVLANDMNHRYEAFIEHPGWETFDSPPDNGVIVHFALRLIPEHRLGDIIERQHLYARIQKAVRSSPQRPSIGRCLF